MGCGLGGYRRFSLFFGAYCVVILSVIAVFWKTQHNSRAIIIETIFILRVFFFSLVLTGYLMERKKKKDNQLAQEGCHVMHLMLYLRFI